MTQEATEELIDKSVWLPKGESIITKERWAKDDCKTVVVADRGGPMEQITFAQMQVRNVMNHLHEKRMLTAQHVHCGQIFELWRMCAYAECGYRNNPIYAGEAMREAKRVVKAEGLEPGDYERAVNELTMGERKLIVFAIEAPATQHHRWLTERNHSHYRTAFDHLAEIMKRLQDEAYARKNNTCEECGLR